MNGNLPGCHNVGKNLPRKRKRSSVVNKVLDAVEPEEMLGKAKKVRNDRQLDQRKYRDLFFQITGMLCRIDPEVLILKTERESFEISIEVYLTLIIMLTLYFQNKIEIDKMFLI